MLFSLEEELFIFLYAVITGAVILAVYDLVSVCSKKGSCPIFVCNVLDGITLSVACAIMLYVTLSVSRGILRFFEFFGVFLGAVLYKLLLSSLFCAIFRKMIDFFCAFFKLFFKILLTPIEFMYKIFVKCINGLLCPIMWAGGKLFGLASAGAARSFHIICKARKKT